jgi:hypothetical protein
MASERQRRQGTRAAEQMTTDPVILGAAASVLLSWYTYFVRGDRLRGLFIGLWAPTIFGFASYFKQTRMDDALQQATGKGGLTTRVQRMVEDVGQ